MCYCSNTKWIHTLLHTVSSMLPWRLIHSTNIYWGHAMPGTVLSAAGIIQMTLNPCFQGVNFQIEGDTYTKQICQLYGGLENDIWQREKKAERGRAMLGVVWQGDIGAELKEVREEQAMWIHGECAMVLRWEVIWAAWRTARSPDGQSRMSEGSVGEHIPGFGKGSGAKSRGRFWAEEHRDQTPCGCQVGQ